MKHVDVKALANELQEPWRPAEICRFDGYHAFVVVVEGSFYPHRHSHDEFYYVLEGEVQVEVNGRVITVPAGQALLVQAGEEHHTSAAQRSVMLVVESRSITYEPTAGPPEDDMYQGEPV
ncbi:MAG: hypothetical protein KatS3mg057_0948 [Herpetosiphonaceae bacterium]|nr:MAG: hypothetical protein KatS3mg057_0948 [Herpetosiphonaceae bacterium]